MKGRIISARFNDEALVEAIHRLYTFFKRKKTKPTPFELLEELNLIGFLKGEPDLSVSYKDYLTDLLLEKHRLQCKKSHE